MKKSLQLIVIMFIISFSCSKNDDNISVPKENSIALEELKSNLKALNVNTFGEAPETRAPWWRYLFTAGADAAVGLLTSNVGWGISASSLAWTISKELESSKELLVDFEPISVYPQTTALKYLSEEDAGYIHNVVILNLYEIYGEDLFGFSSRELVRLVNDELVKVAGHDVLIEDVNQTVEILEQLTEIYANAEDLGDYFTQLKRIDPSKSDELDVLEVFLDGLQNLNLHTDDGVYFDEVIQFIEVSELDTEIKDNLKSGVSIAYASNKLWNSRNHKITENGEIEYIDDNGNIVIIKGDLILIIETEEYEPIDVPIKKK